VKLTIDASIAVKWFVAEPLREEARRLLAHRLHLHAPEILLSEFANTIWKKVRRGEIEDPQPYFDELANLSGIVALHPGGALVDRAARLAVEIDHPVYDVSTWRAPRRQRRSSLRPTRDSPTRSPGDCRPWMSVTWGPTGFQTKSRQRRQP
jgi:predicted nucleic acid-binding protein